MIVVLMTCLVLLWLGAPTQVLAVATDSAKVSPSPVATSSASLAQKINEIKEKAASKAADFLSQVTKKLQNKAYFGIITSIDGEFDKALNFLLAHYYQNCLKQTFLYPGVLETLNALKAQGKIISLCTNKSLRPSQKILEGFGISQFFTTVVAGNSFPEKKPHPMGLEHILKQANTTADRAVMVGDSSVDIQVGKAAGFYTCGCSYGLRPIDEIKLAQPNLIVDRFDQLLEYFH
jgi:phosphoglycolate phosphatase